MDSSRFSRFKFANPRPPPPPPKDDIYQRPNHSQYSLAVVDPPASPMSPTAQYALRRANSPSPSPFSAAENNYVVPNNSSTPSLLSPSAEGIATTRQTSLSSTSKNKALAFLKFPKRSPRTPPAVASSSSPVIVIGNPNDDDLPPPPQEDPGISMPWNFQHNIHVDEGYVGLPPSWSTSLASAGFTEEEIAAIQARRAAGVRSPPDLRYLYNERPQSPGVTTFSGVPILAHPLPRSTSLHRIAPSANVPTPSANSTPIDSVSSPFPPRPALSSINTSTNAGTCSNSSTPVLTRKPPPRRKPPSPLPADLADEVRKTHKPGQASRSTIDHSESGSSSNHHTVDNTNTSFSGLNDSFAYKYNPGDTSNGSISHPPYAQHIYSDDTDDDTPLARVPLRLGSESALSTGSSVKNSMGGPGGNSRFKVMNGDSSEREQPKVPLPVGETSSIENGLDMDGTDMEAEADERPRGAAPNGKETKTHMWGAKGPKSKSKEGLSEPIAQHSSASASSSALSHMGTQASSSTWKTNVVSKGSTFVDAVRGGVAALRGSASASSKEGMTSGLKSTKAKLAASFRNKRHAASTEGGEGDEMGDSDEEFASLPREGDENGPPVWQMYTRPRAGTDASARSTESMGKTQVARRASNRSRDGGPLKKLDPLRRKPSHKSQLSSQSTPSLLNSLKQSRSASSLRSIGKGHQKSGSMTSLESIPEASPPPPLPSGAAAVGTSSSTIGIIGKKTPALPPRLSLHQYSDSSDLSSWSEALLSGISLSAAGKDIGFGLDLDFSNFSRNADDKPSSSAPATATNNGGLTAKPPLFHSQGSSSQSHEKSQSITQNTPSQHTPQPSLSSTPPQRPIATRKPIPNSKPPPQRPIPPTAPPPLPLPPHPYANPALLSKTANSSNASISTSLHGRSRSNSRSRPVVVETTSLSHAQSGWTDSVVPRAGPSEASKPMRIVPTSFTPAISTVIANINMNKQFPQPPEVPSKDASGPVSQGPAGCNKMLSPPPSAWSAAADSVRSPGESSVAPDSAQLWNEIEQMMDPTMMGSIPGLHLSILPLGAQGVLRSAGVPVRSNQGHGNQDGSSSSPLLPEHIALPDAASLSKDLKTVGDLVGLSPTYSAAVTETFSPTLPFTPEEERMEAQRRIMAAEGVLGTKQAVKVERGRQGLANEERATSEDSDYGEGGVYDSVGTLQTLQPSNGLRSREPSRERDEYGQHLTVSRSRERGAGDEFSGRDPNRDSSRSSSSTLTVTALATTTIVRHVSIARRAGAYVINRSDASAPSPTSLSTMEARHPPSPLSGTNSEESGSGDSVSLSSQELELQPTPTTSNGSIASPLLYYLDGTLTPSPTPDKLAFEQRNIVPNTQSHAQVYEDDSEYEPRFEGYPDEETMEAGLAAAAAAEAMTMARPTIIIDDVPLADGPLQPTATISTPGTSAPLSPLQQYRGWLFDVVAPLAEFIDDAVEPREHYLDLNEIAEGESGSVYAAVLNPATAYKLRLPPLVKAKDADEILANRTVLVAIKGVAIVPSGSPKLVDLRRELVLMKGLVHDNVLSMDGLYVDLREDSLWIRMELMERSLADIIGLVGDGLQLQERIIARFASDILLALEYLQHHNIAHRDVRSDNLLLNKHGVLKLADFSNAVQVKPGAPKRSDIVGVPFWQAPEVRKPPYNCLKIDVWSLGATVWEMAQQDPPFADTHQFSDRWPPLRQPELFSPAFHDFLRKCSEPAASRPNPTDLLKSSLVVHKACGRQVIVLLLSQCLAIEQALRARAKEQ